MRSFILVPALALALALTWTAIPAPAAEDEKKAKTPDVSARPPASYTLPKVGKARGRVGGGRRGTGSLPDVYALVPDHVGYTTSTSPT